jgi:hypothetical protein
MKLATPPPKLTIEDTAGMKKPQTSPLYVMLLLLQSSKEKTEQG